MSAPEIPEEEWDSHKDVIVKYFREFTAKQLLQYLKDNHGFYPTSVVPSHRASSRYRQLLISAISSSQLESRLKKWKLRKNVHKKQWQGISASDQRNLENGSGVVTVDGVIVDRKKWMRAKKWAHQQQTAPVQAEFKDEDGTEVRTLSKEVGICTDVTSNPPFSQFDTKFSINMKEYLRMASSERAHNVTYVTTQIETDFSLKSAGPAPRLFPPPFQREAPRGSFRIEASRGSLHPADVHLAETILSHILGGAKKPECHEGSTHVAARLREVMLERTVGDAARQVDQFAKDSKVEQTFRLLRYAVYLSSNNLLPFEKGAYLLSWLQHCNTFWVLGVCVDTHTPTADAFAGMLLVSAATLNDFETCHWLLERGADPNAVAPSSSYRSSTALLEAVRQQHSGLVGLLVEKGAQVNLGKKSLPSPLGEAVLNNSPQSSREKIIRILVSKGADIHQVMEEGQGKGSTILNFAVGKSDIEVAAIFLQSYVAIDSFPKQHPTPLQVAVQAGKMELVEMLLKAGFDVNGRASAESVDREIVGTKEWCICTVLTPLQVALAENNLAVAAVLLREGADVNGFDASECLKARKRHTINSLPLSDDNYCCISRQDLRATSSPLQLAALSRSVSMGRLLLKLGAAVNISGGFGTALQLAVTQQDNLAFVKLLLENGADVNAPAPEPRGRTALQAAVELGDKVTTKLLLHHRAYTNAVPSCEGVTALQAAVLRGDLWLVSHLIQYGANVNAPAAATNGRTALQAAAAAGNLDILYFLLRNGADVDAPAAAENGQTALQAAIAAGNLDILRILLQEGANILAPRVLTGGCSALGTALKQPLALDVILLHAEAERNLDIVINIASFHFSAIDDDGYNEVTASLLKYRNLYSWHHMQQPLQIAVKEGNVALAKKWINAGANAQMCLEGPEGDSIITGAVATGSLEFCALFIKSQVDLEGDRGTEALLVAVSNNDMPMLGFLLSKGASPDWIGACRANRPPPIAKVFELLPSAERFPQQHLSKERMASVLLRHGAKLKGVAFPEEVCGASLWLLQILLGAGLEVNRRLRDQGSLLQFATNKQMEDVVELLLDAGADVNGPPAPSKGHTALQSAVDNENARLVGIFLSKGADVNGPPSPKHGATALQRAVMVGSMPIFVLLLKNGADMNAPAALVGGRTALEAAAEYGRLDMSHILLHEDKEPETLWLRCQRAAKLAASHGFPILAMEFREWKISGFDKPWERDFYAQFEVSSR